MLPLRSVFVLRRLPALMAARGSAREVCQAGNMPKRIVVKAQMAMANDRTPVSVTTSSSRGKRGARETANSVIHCERIKPAMVPARAMRKLSVKRMLDEVATRST